MVRRIKSYSSLIVMHNGHQAWSVGCVSEDRNTTEWIEGLDWPELAELIDRELRSSVKVIPARLIHGGDIMDTHTSLGDLAPLTKEERQYVLDALNDVIDVLQAGNDAQAGNTAGILGAAYIKLACQPISG